MCNSLQNSLFFPKSRSPNRHISEVFFYGVLHLRMHPDPISDQMCFAVVLSQHCQTCESSRPSPHKRRRSHILLCALPESSTPVIIQVDHRSMSPHSKLLLHAHRTAVRWAMYTSSVTPLPVLCVPQYLDILHSREKLNPLPTIICQRAFPIFTATPRRHSHNTRLRKRRFSQIWRCNRTS